MTQNNYLHTTERAITPLATGSIATRIPTELAQHVDGSIKLQELAITYYGIIFTVADLSFLLGLLALMAALITSFYKLILFLKRLMS